MSQKVTLKQLLKNLDLHEIAVVASHLPAMDRDAQVDHIIDLIAAATPWSALGPVGAGIDAVEPGVVKAVAHVVLLLIPKKRRSMESDYAEPGKS